MAINSVADYSKLCDRSQSLGHFGYRWGNGSNGGGNLVTPISHFPRMQNNGSGNISITGGALDSNTYNALLKNPRIPLVSSRKMYIAELEWSYCLSDQSGPRSLCMVYDRLVETTGLTIITTTDEQTTNLPTAPLPRYADGEGVQCLLEMHASTVGGGTATVRYTNSKGEPNRVSQQALFGQSNTNANVANCIFITLQDGDTGVRSVEGVTLGTAGAAVAGNFGVVLYRPLAFTPMDSTATVERSAYRNLLQGGGLIEVLPGAALGLLHFGQSNSTTSHAIMGRVGIITE
jgi:hypothetical protein